MQEHDQGAHSIGIAKKHKRDAIAVASSSYCGDEDCQFPAAFACKACQAEYCEAKTNFFLFNIWTFILFVRFYKFSFISYCTT